MSGVPRNGVLAIPRDIVSGCKLHRQRIEFPKILKRVRTLLQLPKSKKVAARFGMPEYSYSGAHSSTYCVKYEQSANTCNYHTMQKLEASAFIAMTQNERMTALPSATKAVRQLVANYYIAQAKAKEAEPPAVATGAKNVANYYAKLALQPQAAPLPFVPPLMTIRGVQAIAPARTPPTSATTAAAKAKFRFTYRTGYGLLLVWNAIDWMSLHALSYPAFRKSVYKSFSNRSNTAALSSGKAVALGSYILPVVCVV
jgi:hypothetical protein